MDLVDHCDQDLPHASERQETKWRRDQESHSEIEISESEKDESQPDESQNESPVKKHHAKKSKLLADEQAEMERLKKQVREELAKVRKHLAVC